MNPPASSMDIYRFLKRVIAMERVARRTREQIRRVRVMISGASGRCALTPAALNCLPVTPVGSILAAPQQGQSRFAHVTGDSSNQPG